MNNNQQEHKILLQIKQSLNQSVESLDGETRSKLSQARYKALQSKSNNKNWLPLAGTAFASIVALGLFLNLNHQQHNSIDEFPVSLLDNAEDLEIITAIPELEEMEELEFYYWLETRTQNAG